MRGVAVAALAVAIVSACSTDYGSDAPAGPVVTAAGCAPAVPNGWHGPLVLFEASGAGAAQPLPDCPSSSTSAFEGKSDPAPSTGCACSCAPSGAFICKDPVFDFYTDSTCNTHCGAATQIAPTTCSTYDKTSCPGAPYVKIGDAQATGASCAPSTTPPDPASWTKTSRLCQPTSTDSSTCPVGQVGAPAATPPYDTSRVCIASLGKLACPPEYPEAHVYFDATSIVDARRCKTCACGDVKGGCGGQVKFSDKNCTESSWPTSFKDVVDIPTSCFALTNIYEKTLVYSAPQKSGGTCDPSGGGVEGDIGGTSLSVCCRGR